MVYVSDKDGQPLMPTKRYGKVRHLLKEGKAKVVRRMPFTIQLLYDSGEHTQPVDLGVDAGSKHIGLSACSDKAELFAAEVEPRDAISKHLTSRKESRRTRRSRKTRYREPRFDNRTHHKKEGWLAPSVKCRCETHLTAIRKVMSLLPVSGITIEMAPFDTQKLKADILDMKAPSGTDYQHGESEGYDNIRAYVRWRDGYKCAVCGREHIPLQVHHKKQRKDGGSNMPANLITVCVDCVSYLSAVYSVTVYLPGARLSICITPLLLVVTSLSTLPPFIWNLILLTTPSSDSFTILHEPYETLTLRYAFTGSTTSDP